MDSVFFHSAGRITSFHKKGKQHNLMSPIQRLALSWNPSALKFLILLSVFAVGCHARRTLSNDEIIRESRKCQDAGFRAALYKDGWTLQPYQVVCEPKDYPK